jgi:hypothetical protein
MIVEKATFAQGEIGKERHKPHKDKHVRPWRARCKEDLYSGQQLGGTYFNKQQLFP